MDAIIDKILNILTKQTRKITQSLIVLFIFTALFPKEAIKAKDILSSKLQIISPAFITDFFVKLPLSQKDLLTLWAFLLVTFTITVFLDILNQLLKGHNYLVIGAGSEKLFEINSILLISILIHNTLYNPGILISSIEPAGFYGLFVIFSFILFFFIFCITYCVDFILIFKKINNPDLSLKQKIIFNILYFIVVSLIFSEISKILF